jgi:hypothetical protein
MRRWWLEFSFKFQFKRNPSISSKIQFCSSILIFLTAFFTSRNIVTIFYVYGLNILSGLPILVLFEVLIKKFYDIEAELTLIRSSYRIGRSVVHTFSQFSCVCIRLTLVLLLTLSKIIRISMEFSKSFSNVCYRNPVGDNNPRKIPKISKLPPLVHHILYTQ